LIERHHQVLTRRWRLLCVQAVAKTFSPDDIALAYAIGARISATLRLARFIYVGGVATAVQCAMMRAVA
jgi:hypothetical protein